MGHIIRTIRWRLLMDDKLSFSFLVNNLSITYLINSFVPYRLAEIMRIILPCKKTKISYFQSTAALIYEKISDLTIVCIFLIFLENSEDQKQGIFLQLLFSVLVTLLVSLTLSKKVQVRLLKLSNMLRSHSGLFLLRFLDSQLTLSDRLKKIWKLWLLLTVPMWCLYLGAFYFSAFLFKTEPRTLIQSIYTNAFDSTLGTLMKYTDITNAVAFCIWIGIPLLIFSLCYRLLPSKFLGVLRSKEKKLSMGINYRKVFLNEKEYRKIVKQVILSRELQIRSLMPFLKFQDKVLENISGGSGAATYLILRDQNKLAVKIGADQIQSSFLYKQSMAINNLRESGVNTVSIIRVLDGLPETFGYETSFEENSHKLSDHILKNSSVDFKILERFLDDFKTDAYQQDQIFPEGIKLADVYSSKIAEIFEEIEINLKDLRRDYRFIVNGTPINILNEKDFRDSLRTFPAVFHTSKIVHGDLTLENLLYLSHKELVISLDPNPNQLLVHPSVDFGKLLQSLRLGYENLEKEIQPFNPKNIDQKIDYTLPSNYLYLLSELNKYLSIFEIEMNYPEIRRLSEGQYLMHILRLLPYKLKIDPGYFPIFVAILSYEISEKK